MLESIRTKGLNRTQLKIIAIICMVVDHTAWGFLDFYTPLAQVMHVIGRMTIPTMCFFIAEGYAHTSNKWRYLQRMATFWIVTLIPFYLFFGWEYGYRQSIIFDYMLALIMLIILDSKKLKVWQKVLLALLDVAISCAVGGWVLAPICFTVAFYYGKDFKQKAKWICGLVISLVIFLVVVVNLNQIYHFSHYDWVWYGQLYFLGFMIPLLLLRHYNGEKGKDLGKYFFYVFYPGHFMILWLIKQIFFKWSVYESYVACHFLFLFVVLFLLVIIMQAKPSKGLSSTILLSVAASVYIFGFTLEILSSDLTGKYTATLVEYFGESILMVTFTMFVFTMCRRRVPSLIYATQIAVGIATMWLLFTTKENHFFYKSMSVEPSGEYTKFILEWNTGFWAFMVYMAVITIMNMVVCGYSLIHANGVEKKRLFSTMMAMIFPWIPFVLQHTGLTGGLEIPALGIMGASVCVCLALLRFQYFDSVITEGTGALNHGKEGFLVADMNLKMVYCNDMVNKLFGEIPTNYDLHKHDILSDIFLRDKQSLTKDGEIYEFRKEDLEEGGYKQGYILWILNVTEHYSMVEHLNEMATTDGLTQIQNRSAFTEEVEAYLQEGHGGSLFMMDMDRFKKINDHYGHQAGDRLLQIFGHALDQLAEDVFVCRLGGDEFSLFYKDVTDRETVLSLVDEIFMRTKLGMKEEPFADVASTSIGITMTEPGSGLSFEKMYSIADKALYQAKREEGFSSYIMV